MPRPVVTYIPPKDVPAWLADIRKVPKRKPLWRTALVTLVPVALLIAAVVLWS